MRFHNRNVGLCVTLLLIFSYYLLYVHQMVKNDLVVYGDLQFSDSTPTVVQPHHNQSVYPLTEQINVGSKLQTVFDGIYKKLFWGPQGAGSGPGSALNHTYVLRKHLMDIFLALQVNSMADIPCGGMVWTRKFLHDIWKIKPMFIYYGFDIVNSVIDTLHKEINDPRVTTKQFDIVAGKPSVHVDAVICRDMLQHLSLRDCCEALKNLVSIHTRYILIGTYQMNMSRNRNIKAGSYFLINLSLAPFNLPPPSQSFQERFSGTETKFIYVYKRDDLMGNVTGWRCETF